MGEAAPNRLPAIFLSDDFPGRVHRNLPPIGPEPGGEPSEVQVVSVAVALQVAAWDGMSAKLPRAGGAI
jgi:hypothetical protein